MDGAAFLRYVRHIRSRAARELLRLRREHPGGHKAVRDYHLRGMLPITCDVPPRVTRERIVQALGRNGPLPPALWPYNHRLVSRKTLLTALERS